MASLVVQQTKICFIFPSFSFNTLYDELRNSTCHFKSYQIGVSYEMTAIDWCFGSLIKENAITSYILYDISASKSRSIIIHSYETLIGPSWYELVADLNSARTITNGRQIKNSRTIIMSLRTTIMSLRTMIMLLRTMNMSLRKWSCH